MFEEDDDFSLDNNPFRDSHLTSADEEEEEVEEHFPTAPLNDDIWMEEPVLDRHLCIQEHSKHDLCPHPCPYSLDQLHLTPDYAPTTLYLDLSYISDFPHVITTTSDEDIPNWEDVLKL